VPLYISNSDTRMQQDNLKRTWLLALLMVFILLGSWDMFWRSQGFLPSVEDDMNIWHLQRSKISKNTRIVFVGASRIQLGLHPDVFAEQLGTIPVNLSIDGNPPFPVLEDLANDQQFSGIVFCSILPRWLAEKTPDKNRASKWVRKYYKRTVLSKIEALLSILLQKTFVFRYPGLSLEKLKKQIEKGEWPSPSYSPMRPDRFREAKFTAENTPGILASRIKREKKISQQSVIISAHGFNKRIQSIKEDVRKIKQRGGAVIFIRMPSSGRIREIETTVWPRKSYWDVFADHISEQAIHFEDFKELKDFYCPDGSHLDQANAKKFTRQLLKIASFDLEKKI